MRTTTIIETNFDFTSMMQGVDKLMRERGYVPKTIKGQQVYTKGNGFIIGPRRFAFTNKYGKVQIETWISIQIFPAIKRFNGISIGKTGLKNKFFFNGTKTGMRHTLMEIVGRYIKPGLEAKGYNPQKKLIQYV